MYINQRLQIQFVAPDDERCAGAVCRSKHVEPSINFGIINSITKLHLVGISIESYYDAGGSRDRYAVTGVFFPGHQTVPCALGSTQPLKMSTRIFLGVKTAGA